MRATVMRRDQKFPGLYFFKDNSIYLLLQVAPFVVVSL